MSERSHLITLKKLKSLKILRSNDPDPAVQARFRKIEEAARAEFAPRIEAARRAEMITAEDLNQIVGPSPEFGSRVRFP